MLNWQDFEDSRVWFVVAYFVVFKSSNLCHALIYPDDKTSKICEGKEKKWWNTSYDFGGFWSQQILLIYRFSKKLEQATGSDFI